MKRILLILALCIACAAPLHAQKISALTELTSPATGDLLPITDISDTTSAASGTTKRITIANLFGGTTPLPATFTTLTAGSTTSLLLGTAGSAVGNIGFRNATSGTATLAPPTGALGTYTITLPNAASTLPIFGQQLTFTGPTAARSFALPDAAATILTTNDVVTVAQGGTGRATGTTAYALIATGTTATGAQQTLASGATTELLVGGGASALPVWTTATGSGAPVRATSPTLVTPALGTPSALTLTNATGLPIATGVSGLGTGVATALAVNTGGAGAVVLFNGAGGTPSSIALTNATSIPVALVLDVGDEPTNLSTGTAKKTFRLPFAMTVTAVRASVNTAPAGSTIIVDINEGGASLLSTKLSIDDSELTSTTAAAPAVISDAALADDAEITIDLDQVGSGTPGKGLKVILLGTRQ